MVTNITKLKQSEYRKGAKLTFQNYEDLIEITEKAEQIGNYGIASSLCVLALEELSKSVVLQLRSINNQIPIKNLEKYFRSHETKQNAGIVIFETLQSNYQDEEEVLSDDYKSNFSLAIAITAIAIFALEHISKNEKGIKKNSKSFFDTIKESGFYVGYNEFSRQWICPRLEHNRESFTLLFNYIKEFAVKVKKWIFDGKINKDNIIEFLNSLDDELIDKAQLEKMKLGVD